MHPFYPDTLLLDFLSQNKTWKYSVYNKKLDPLGAGWMWDDYMYYYSSEKSVFPIYGNSVKAIKGKGCPKCKDTGYKGRQGIYEILVVSKPLKEAILRQATTPELREIGVKEGFQTMQDMGRRLIASGELNFREYERVLSEG